MARNPYELRWELLQQAESRLIHRYSAQENRYNVLLEKGEETGKYPEYPSDAEIHALAEEMRSFIERSE